MSELAKAIVAVMAEVKGIEKSMKVGSGNYAYQGVADKDVKQVIGRAMSKNGLSLLPTKITPRNTVTVVDGKSKIFLEVDTEYLLLHTSGESMKLAGYGHAQDNGDKAAGKATTYALKYTLLYTFLVPTGEIDDTDATHSEDLAKKTRAPSVKAQLSERMQSFFGITHEEVVQFFKGRGGCTDAQAEGYLKDITVLGDDVTRFVDEVLPAKGGVK